MTTGIFWIRERFFDNEQLGMMPCPGGNENLEEEIKNLKAQGVDTLVCLLEQQEMESLGLALEEFYCRQAEMNFYHFPIPDYGVPTDTESFLTLVKRMDGELQDRKKLVVHCKGGIGRSSLVIAGVLLRKGVSLPFVFPTILRHRGFQVPETTRQKDWIWRLSKRLTKLV